MKDGDNHTKDSTSTAPNRNIFTRLLSGLTTSKKKESLVKVQSFRHNSQKSRPSLEPPADSDFSPPASSSSSKTPKGMRGFFTADTNVIGSAAESPKPLETGNSSQTESSDRVSDSLDHGSNMQSHPSSADFS
jgi:hypothetical protein